MSDFPAENAPVQDMPVPANPVNAGTPADAPVSNTPIGDDVDSITSLDGAQKTLPPDAATAAATGSTDPLTGQNPDDVYIVYTAEDGSQIRVLRDEYHAKGL
jgi:hypothetical protein